MCLHNIESIFPFSLWTCSFQGTILGAGLVLFQSSVCMDRCSIKWEGALVIGIHFGIPYLEYLIYKWKGLLEMPKWSTSIFREGVRSHSFTIARCHGVDKPFRSMPNSWVAKGIGRGNARHGNFYQGTTAKGNAIFAILMSLGFLFSPGVSRTKTVFWNLGPLKALGYFTVLYFAF